MRSLADLYYGGGPMQVGPQDEPSLQGDMRQVYGDIARRMRKQYQVGNRDQLPEGMDQPNYAIPAGMLDPFGLAQTLAPDSALARMQQSDPMGAMMGGGILAGPAMKGIGMVGQGIGAAAKAAPKTLASLFGGTVATAPNATAENSGAPQASDLSPLYQRRQELDQERRRAALERDAEGRSGKGPKYKAASQRVSDLESQIAAVSEEIKLGERRNSPEYRLEMDRKAFEEAERRAKVEANKPFIERNPEVAAALPVAGLVAAAGVPAAGRFISQAARNRPIREWRNVYDNTEKALLQTDMLGRPAPNNARAEIGMNQLEEFNKAFPKGELKAPKKLPFYQPSEGLMASMLFGAGVGAEARMFPDQFDAVMLPDDNPQKAEARARALNPLEYAKAAAIGTLGGASGYKATKMLTPDLRGPIEKSKGILGPPRPPRGPPETGSRLPPPEFPPQQGPRGGLLEPPDAPIGGGGPKQPPDPPRGTQPGNDPPKGGSQRKSKTFYDPLVHTPAAGNYIDEVLRSGQQLPPGRDMAAELAGRFEAAGVPAVWQSNLTNRSNTTRAAINAGADPSSVLGQTQYGYLSVPAGVTLGGAAASDPNADLNGNGIPDLIEEFLAMLPPAQYPY